MGGGVRGGVGWGLFIRTTALAERAVKMKKGDMHAYIRCC